MKSISFVVRAFLISMVGSSFVFAAETAPTAPAVPAAIREVTNQYSETMVKCPERIWENYTWDNTVVVLFYPSDQTAWMWNATTNEVASIEYSRLPATITNSTYQFFDLNGRKGMSISMEAGNFVPFETGVHKFFHNLGQKGWTVPEGFGGRGTAYPVAHEPRLYRRLIFDHLKSYLVSGNADDLARASHWYHKWTNEYPKEPLSTTDGYEGTGRYVESLAAALVVTTCAGSEADLRLEALDIVNRRFGSFMSGRSLGLDHEGYDLGGLAAVILRFNSSLAPDWYSRVAKGETPVQVLLANVSELADTADPALQGYFQSQAAKINIAYGSLIDQDIANWKDSAYVRVAVPVQHLLSNLRPRFFAQATEIGLNLFPLGPEHSFVSSDSRVNLKLSANSVVFDDVTPLCPTSGLFTLVPTASISLNSGAATIASPTVNGVMPAQLKLDSAGFTYLCP